MAESYLKSDGYFKLWKTSLDANDSSAQETIGAIRRLEDGRVFRYVKMTGQAITAGLLVKPAAVISITNLTSDTTKKVITDSDASWTPNAYVGYYFKVLVSMTGSEEAIKIVANTVNTLTLERALTTGLTSAGTDDAEIIAPPGAVIIAAASDQSQPVSGVAIGPITENYYGWVQIKGFGNVIGTNLTETQPVTPGGATAGYALDGAAATDVVVGICIAGSSGTGKAQLVWLDLSE
jgi:hypothetical protein